MPRYEAHDHPDAIVGGWDVKRDGKCPRRMPGWHWTEAEAHAIAWALNTVAQGDTLVAMSHPTWLVLSAHGHNVTRYEGPTVAPPEPCKARIWHGPGHQSSTQCRLRGEHEIHEAVYGEFNQFAEWRTRADGKHTFTGVFDEPPQGDDE